MHGVLNPADAATAFDIELNRAEVPELLRRAWLSIQTGVLGIHGQAGDPIVYEMHRSCTHWGVPASAAYLMLAQTNKIPPSLHELFRYYNRLKGLADDSYVADASIPLSDRLPEGIRKLIKLVASQHQMTVAAEYHYITGDVGSLSLTITLQDGTVAHANCTVNELADEDNAALIDRIMTRMVLPS